MCVESARLAMIGFFEQVGALDSARATALRSLWQDGGVERSREMMQTDPAGATALLRLLSDH